jgi:pilus assembly protein Flp/PilA
MTKLKRFFKKEEGVTAIEYGLIAFLIAIVCIGTWTLVGGRLVAIFGQVVTALGG